MFTTNADSTKDIDIAAKIAAMDLNDNEQASSAVQNDDLWGRVRPDVHNLPNPELYAEADDTKTEAWIEVDAQRTDEDVNGWIDEMSTLADANAAEGHKAITIPNHASCVGTGNGAIKDCSM